MRFNLTTTPERSKLMSRIKGKNTVAEVMLAKALWHEGIRYRRNYSKLPGTPDIAITKHKIAVFVDGEFWHGYNWEEKKKRIKSNREYWINKIERNMARDERNNMLLKKDGWTVIRFWEKEVKQDLYHCVDIIKGHIEDK